jgi:hypothetical protein
MCGSQLVMIDLDFFAKTYSQLYVNSVLVQNNNGGVYLTNGAVISIANGNQNTIVYTVELPFIGTMTIIGDPNNKQSQITLSVYQGPFKNNGLSGICGNYNGVTNDDTSTSSCMNY